MVENGAACLTILVVEDFEDSRYIIRRALESRGDYQVIEATDGLEAVEMVRSDCPDLILMDLNLPQIDGLTATRRIRECKDACKDVPIIAITAHHTYGIKDAALEAGCNAYVQKPLDFDELERIIRQTLAGW
jgi:CheY-like chemotaxis protein